MKILQIGTPKCGNFWLYKIIQGILIRSGQNKPNFIEQQPIYQLAKNWDLNYPEQAQIDMIDITDLQTSYRISSIYRMPIDNMKEYISKTGDRKSTRLNSSHVSISYAVFCLKKKTRKPK